MAKRVQRQTVSKKQLLKVGGTAEVIAAIEAQMDRMTGEAIKDALINAAKPLWAQAKSNIAALPIGRPAKEMLDAQVSIMRGKPKQPKVVVGMSQHAGLKKLGGRHRSWNPYWWEFGTRERKGPRGAIKATPFFRPAVTASKDQVRNRLAYELKLIVQKP